MKTESDMLSIYLHIPFCSSRCKYCDFNTYVGYGPYIDDYVNSLIIEISCAGEYNTSNLAVESIYFGGGTPTLLNTHHYSAILKSISGAFKVSSRIEISTEANPCGLSENYLTGLAAAGVNRLSIGMQTGIANELKLLGRNHSMEDVAASVSSARKAGIQNLNLDLIFGIPGQTLVSFRQSLMDAVQLRPEHLSLYSLSLEDSTVLAEEIRLGEISAPDEDLVADMYEMAMELLAENNYNQYEISNWSLFGRYECRHNLQYWRNLQYLGFGAGAHSHYNSLRWENHHSIKEYIYCIKKVGEKSRQPTAIEVVKLEKKLLIQETIMMGLRLTNEGLDVGLLKNRFDVDIEKMYAREIEFLIKQDLLEWGNYGLKPCLKLTRRGRMLGNQVFMQFMGE